MQKSFKRSGVCFTMMSIASAAFVQLPHARAASFQLVGSIGSYKGGAGGLASLTSDTAGNLYVPWDISAGLLYEVFASSGYTTSQLLYTFNSNGSAGVEPNAVTINSHNVILETTSRGGTNNGGAVFTLNNPHKIVETTLHAFLGSGEQPTDGFAPESGLTFGAVFNRYYGTTTYGGIGLAGRYLGAGVVYQTSESPTSPHYKILHRFGLPGDGANPSFGNLAIDDQGRLFGETIIGGTNNVGTVFMMQYVEGGWQEQVLYSFQSTNDLDLPAGNVVLDAEGNLYGCAQGGSHGQGGIFELTPPSQGGAAWQETVLYNFGDRVADPVAADDSPTGSTYDLGCGITLDPLSNIIVGVSWAGGAHNLGTIFTLVPPAPGQNTWTETIGHNFAGGKGGSHPYAPLLRIDGVYYGGGEDDNEIYAFTP